MKKKLLILVLCLPIFLPSSYSQTKKESIKELLNLMHQKSTMDKMLNSMIPSMMSQMDNRCLNKDSTVMARLNEIMKSTMKATSEIMTKMIDEDLVDLYDRYFSQREIDDFITFYNSPSGQKFITITPEISKDLMTIMMQKYMPEIRSIVNKQIDLVKDLESK